MIGTSFYRFRFDDGGEASLKLSEIYTDGKRVKNIVLGGHYDGTWGDLTYSGVVINFNGGHQTSLSTLSKTTHKIATPHHRKTPPPPRSPQW